MKKIVFIVFVLLAIFFVYGSSFALNNAASAMDQNSAANGNVAVNTQNITGYHELALAGPTLFADCIVSAIILEQPRGLRYADKMPSSALAAGNLFTFINDNGKFSYLEARGSNLVSQNKEGVDGFAACSESRLCLGADHFLG